MPPYLRVLHGSDSRLAFPNSLQTTIGCSLPPHGCALRLSMLATGLETKGECLDSTAAMGCDVSDAVMADEPRAVHDLLCTYAGYGSRVESSVVWQSDRSYIQLEGLQRNGG